VDEFVERETWPALVPMLDALDVLIDACDSQPAKRMLVQWAGRPKSQRQIKLLVCGAAGGKRLAHRVELADIADTTHDPLLARLRYQLRKEGWPREGKMNVSCVFSREAVAPPHASCSIDGAGDGSLNCHGFGSSVAVTGAFGLVAAGWALEKIAQQA
jgi:tRNA A37 threonylcarbamoyladenosine dehydratase